MTKEELRKTFLDRRKQLTDQDLQTLSRQICGRFMHAIDLKRIHCLHIYLPLLRQSEVDTYLVIEQIRYFHPHIRLAVPKVEANSPGMESFRFDETTEVALNAWGIPEPVDSSPVAPAEIDCIILPLLAFDENGYRVGYGKGFYDRYLVHCRPDALKVGFSCFDPVPAVADVTPLDVRMDLCVTPLKLWRFKS